MAEEWKEVVAEWEGESGFTGKNTAGGSIQIGTVNGRPGVGPMEMLLLGVAGCTGIDIVSILDKKRQNLQDFQIRVRGRRAKEYPRVYKEIEVTYLLWGTNIDSKAVEHAIQLSEEKYCSASIMMRAVADMHSTYHILAPGERFLEAAMIPDETHSTNEAKA
jgi:putative redox protein